MAKDDPVTGMKMKVIPSERGWDVVEGDKVLASFPTNEKAWRFFDLQQSGAAISRSEHVVNWINRKLMDR